MRLTAAMVGLLRSFSTFVFTSTDEYGTRLCDMVNQDELPRREMVAALREQLRDTMASLRSVIIGSGRVTEDLDSARCSSSAAGPGGHRPGPRRSDHRADRPRSAEGSAENAPYLYFTVIAMDAIEDLFSERTRLLGLLNEEQQRLSRALQLRWDLTRTYWATVATFGDGRRWPLEDIPWRTTDGEESDYYTLQVTSLAVKGLIAVGRGGDEELGRIGSVLVELASRAADHPAARHRRAGARRARPGVRVTLKRRPAKPIMTLERERVLHRCCCSGRRPSPVCSATPTAQRAARAGRPRCGTTCCCGACRTARHQGLWDHAGGAFPAAAPKPRRTLLVSHRAGGAGSGHLRSAAVGAAVPASRPAGRLRAGPARRGRTPVRPGADARHLRR